MEADIARGDVRRKEGEREREGSRGGRVCVRVAGGDLSPSGDVSRDKPKERERERGGGVQSGEK